MALLVEEIVCFDVKETVVLADCLRMLLQVESLKIKLKAVNWYLYLTGLSDSGRKEERSSRCHGFQRGSSRLCLAASPPSVPGFLSLPTSRLGRGSVGSAYHDLRSKVWTAAPSPPFSSGAPPYCCQVHGGAVLQLKPAGTNLLQ